MSEEWIAESDTGGRKGQKLARYDLLDPGVLDAIARQFGRGAFKYGDRNYQKGYNWSLSYAAAQRHLNAFWGGDDWDADPFWGEHELGRPHHLDAAIFHLMALREFFNKHPEFDDRSKIPTEVRSSEWAATRVEPAAEKPGRRAAIGKRAAGSVTGFEQATQGDGVENRAEEAHHLSGRRVSDISASRREIP